MPSPQPKHPILTDRPAEADGLDFQPYIDSLAELIIDQATSTPLTIGIFGQWGSGKTSLMHLIQAQVKAQPRYKTVWFNAWKYEREDLALWRALILRTLDALRPRRDDGTPWSLEELPDPGQKKLVGDLDRLEQSVYQTVEWTELGQWTVDWVKALEGTVEGAAEIALSLVPGAGPLVELLRKARNTLKGEEVAPLTEAFQREAREFHREQLRSVEQFILTFEETIREHVVAQKGRLVIFIDDLDRCLPERTIEVLEAIKLFLDVPGCFFILGVDPAKIQEGVRLRYKIAQQSAEGANYLEKIIQLPFILPAVERQDMQAFVNKLNVDFPEGRCAAVFAQGLAPNPRQIKRAINIFLLLWRLTGRRRLKGDADGPKPLLLSQVLTPVRLAKVVAVQHSYPDLYELLKLTPRYLRELESYYRQRGEAGRVDEAQAIPTGPETEGPPQADLPPALEPYAEQANLRRLLTLFLEEEAACFAALTPAHLRLYFTLAGRAETERPSPQAQARLDIEPELILIPAGSFRMGSTAEELAGLPERFQSEIPQHQVSLPAYRIGRYLVTNLQYQAFVEATGHSPPRHWEGGQLPLELSDHPVVNVSWEDAMAYCLWLSEVSGRAYRLPTEAEWEKAARGTDRRIYPWGNDWDKTRANTQEAGIGATTPVGQYSPAGDSPYGLADMAGDVWEWTQSLWGRDFEKPDFKYPYDSADGREDLEAEGLRVLRGGSWNNDRYFARCAARVEYILDLRNVNLGFRLVFPIGNAVS
jgi:formylglycine-generating enzyme required for sulfatase activity